jgi:hypothetical protein
MPTTKKRINISVPKSLEDALGRLSKRDEVPVASKAAELLRIAIDIEEDQVWDKIATERLRKEKRHISHKNAWK